MRTTVIFEDEDILVCRKPAGLPVETKQMSQMDMVSELKNYLRSKTKKVPYLAVIHRLDQPVEGIVVFAKSKNAAQILSEEMKKGEMTKLYLAAVYGKVEKQKAELEDYLYKDGVTNITKVVDQNFIDEKGEKGKYSHLSYELLGEKEEDGVSYSVVKIHLDTGRHHQIRIQFAHRNLPLLGDLKYGTEESIEASELLYLGNVALCAYSLSFFHPRTKKKMEFVLPKIPALLKISR